MSSQVGCKFGCHFCASGIGGFKRNLSTAEILDQILHVKKSLARIAYHLPLVTHIVFMGIGEPLDNYDRVLNAIRLINDKRGLSIGARRITISTCGVIPKIKELAQAGLQLELSVSLHGYDDASRNALMPVNKQYPFDGLMKVCREYTNRTKRQITFEYILVKDLTCTGQAARQLKKAFKGIICKMNLIPYNPVPEFAHQRPLRQEMVVFQKQLQDQGLHATLRLPRGQDVTAACGQLRHNS